MYKKENWDKTIKAINKQKRFEEKSARHYCKRMQMPYYSEVKDTLGFCRYKLNYQRCKLYGLIAKDIGQAARKIFECFIRR